MPLVAYSSVIDASVTKGSSRRIAIEHDAQFYGSRLQENERAYRPMTHFQGCSPSKTLDAYLSQLTSLHPIAVAIEERCYLYHDKAQAGNLTIQLLCVMCVIVDT